MDEPAKGALFEDLALADAVQDEDRDQGEDLFAEECQDDALDPGGKPVCRRHLLRGGGGFFGKPGADLVDEPHTEDDKGNVQADGECHGFGVLL
jgi:hypothetical protein